MVMVQLSLLSEVSVVAGTTDGGKAITVGAVNGIT